MDTLKAGNKAPDFEGINQDGEKDQIERFFR
jgi:peroxiredoxin